MLQEQISSMASSSVLHFARGISSEADTGQPPWNSSTTRIHRHIQKEILFVLDGYFTYLCNGKTYELNSGSILLIDSWEPHLVGYPANIQDLQSLWFFFQGNCLSARIIQIGKGTVNASRFNDRIFSLPKRSYTLFTTRWNDWKESDHTSPERFLLNPFRCLLEDLAFAMDSENHKHNATDLVHAIQLYIEEHNATDCDLEKLENVFGYNRFYLAHLFRRQTGQTIGNFINYVRFKFMENANCKGLKQKEIAYELGFSSPSAFAKWCKRYRDKYDLLYPWEK